MSVKWFECHCGNLMQNYKDLEKCRNCGERAIREIIEGDQ